MTGRYEIGDEIGRGVTSVVHRGRDLLIDRPVAIKVLRADHRQDRAFRSRFRRQARNAALLNHPAIVAVYDTGELSTDEGVAGEPFIVMELVDGRTLRAALAADGPPIPGRAAEIVTEVCAALDFSHRHGILHRSVSPENVMLESGGAVKVMDFGIPRPILVDHDGPPGGSARAAQYLSPEQARGEPVDARSDVYGTGCLLFELLTGSPPFTGDDPVAIAYRQVSETPGLPSDLAATVPADLDAIVLKALAKDPLDRYQSAADLGADLSRVLAGAPALAAASVGGPPGARPTARRSDRVSPPLLAPPSRGLPPDDGDRPARRRSRRVWSYTGFGLTCFVALAAAVWLTTSVITAPPPQRPIAVPDLSGLTVDAARQVLTDKGLIVGAVTEQDSTDPDAGRVMQQRPSGLTEVGRGTAVNLIVGHGVRAVSVPDLDGMTPDQARQALAPLRLTYVEQTQPSSDADKGRVVAQSPGAHETAAPDTAVIVTVGTGLPMVTVPEGILGVGVDEATGILQAVGLTAVGVEQDGTQDSGIVMGADHPPGQQVPEGSPITLNYSNNALMVMPNLVGRSPAAAAAALQDRGWAGDAGTFARTPSPTGSASLIGAVVTQQPVAGSVVRKFGTPVSVGIGVIQVTMPALVGRTRPEAEAALAAAGATSVTFRSGGTAPQGQQNRVRGQSVPAGTAITADTSIVIVVYD